MSSKINAKHSKHKLSRGFQAGRDVRGGGYRDDQAAPKDIPRASNATANLAFHPGQVMSQDMSSWTPWFLILGAIGVMFIVTRMRT